MKYLFPDPGFNPTTKEGMNHGKIAPAFLVSLSKEFQLGNGIKFDKETVIFGRDPDNTLAYR